MAATFSAAGWTLSRAIQPDSVYDYHREEDVTSPGDHVTVWYISANGVQRLLHIKNRRKVDITTDDEVSAAASQLGTIGGEVSTPAKAAAARANGALGGRPPKG